MKKLSLAALLVLLSACNRQQQIEGEAIHAKVVVPPSVIATCVLFEVRDATSHNVLKKEWLNRDDGELRIAIFRGDLPETVELAARPYVDGDCAKGAEAQTYNGPYETVVATFVKGRRPDETPLELKPSPDKDNDQYVDSQAGGRDCADGDDTVHPGQAEVCQDQRDLNCDGKRGCEKEGCGDTACIGPPDTLALSVPASVDSGTCTPGTVQVKDERGSNTKADRDTDVALRADPANRVAFYSDAACTLPIAGVRIGNGEGQAPFFFRGQIVGSATLTASASSLDSGSASVNVTLGTSNQLAFASPARSARAGVCSAEVQVQSRNAQGTATPAPVNTFILLQADPATDFLFYSDSNCQTPVTSVSLPAGTTNAGFFFKGTRAGSVTVTISASNYNGATQPQMVTAGPPAVVDITGPETAQAGSCPEFFAVLRDTYGNPSPPGTNRGVTITATNMVRLSSTNACGSTSSSVSVTVPGNGTSVAFYAKSKDNAAVSTTLTASASLPPNATHSLVFTPGPATVLAFSPGQQTVQAGSCSAAVTVEQRDVHGNPVSVAGPTTVGLSSNSTLGFQFFADPTCTGPAVTSVTMAADSASASFYFKGTRVETVTMTAVTPSVSGTQQAIIRFGPPHVLVFPPPPPTVTAAVCTAVQVQLQDQHGNPHTVSGSSVQVGLTANPPAGFTISSQATCGNTVSNVSIPVGQNTATFYVRRNLVGDVTVTATGPTGINPGSVTLKVNAGPPKKLVFLPPEQMVEVGKCSAVTTVAVQDAGSNEVDVNGDTQVNLTSSAANTTFHTDAACMTPTVDAFVIPTDSSRVTFYFKSGTVGQLTLTASATGLDSGPQQHTITPPQPTELVFTTAAQTLKSDVCSGEVRVETRAQGVAATVNANRTVSLTAAPSAGFKFYSDVGCNTEVTQVTISQGQSSARFYFRGRKAGTVVMTADAQGLVATQNAIITASKLVFTTSPLTTESEICSAAVTVRAADADDGPAPVAANTVVTLNESGDQDSHFEFYAEPTCATAVTTRTIQAGQSDVSFYYRGRKARAVSLTVSATGLSTTPPQIHTIIGKAAVSLVFSSTTPSGMVLAGACTRRRVESRDIYGNPGSSSLTVGLSASSEAGFFLDANCTSPTSQVSIPGGMSSADFYFKGIKGGINSTAPLTLTASPTGLSAVTQVENIIPTVRTGNCTIANGVLSTRCTITPALADLAKAFLVFQATIEASSSARANVRCFLDALSELQCERGGSGTGNSVTIQWSVAEFPSTSGVAVQHRSAPCAGDLTSVSLSPVDKDEAFLLLSSKRNEGFQGNSVPRIAELTLETQAEIRKTGGCDTATHADTNHLQVVSYPGAAVQRGIGRLTVGTSEEISLSPAVALDRSILLYSYISDGSGQELCRRVLRGELINNGGAVRFTRGDGDAANCASSNFTAISWEVVQFPMGTSVRQLTQPLAAGTASVSIPLAPAVDASRTVVFAGGQWASGQALGEGRYAGGEFFSEVRARAALAEDGTSVTLTRDTSNASARFTLYVVQFKP